MNRGEVAQLIQFAAANGTRITGDEPAVVQAWWMALDERMTLNDALACAALAFSEGDRVLPGTINSRYLAAIRDPAQQGYGRPHLPIQAHLDSLKPKRLPPAISDAVPSYSVPEYTQARAAQTTRGREVPCDRCGAEIGHPCKDGMDRMMKHIHPSRLDKAGHAPVHVTKRRGIKQKAVSAP